MKQHAYAEDEEDPEIGYEDFERGILELFNLDDIEEYDEAFQNIVKNAIEELFYVFDTDDAGVLDTKHLEMGFKKFLPNSKTTAAQKIINPLHLATVESIFKQIDTDGTGIIHIDHFVKYLEPYIEDKERLKEFATLCALDADENRSGNVSKLEFIKWSETRGYIHLINVLEGKGAPFSIEDSPRSLEDQGVESQRSSRLALGRSKTMKSTVDKELFIHDIFTNKNKEGLSKVVKKLKEKKKLSDFQSIFKSIDFRAAIKDINTLAHNSGLYRINPLDLIRYLKKVLRDYDEGFNEDQFIDFMFKFTKQEKLTAYQKKIRESALRRIFIIIDVDGNKIADYTELSE